MCLNWDNGRKRFISTSWYSKILQQYRVWIIACFKGVNIARTRSVPGADTGNDHDLLMMTFHNHLKRISKPKHTRLRFDLEKLKGPIVIEFFQPTIGWKFAPLTMLNNEDADMASMITTVNTAMTKTATENLGKHRQKKRKEKPWLLQKFLIYARKGENWGRKDF